MQVDLCEFKASLVERERERERERESSRTAKATAASSSFPKCTGVS
jgi:hypothetical protein